ncbi:MAG: cytochrome c oxidase subunit 3 [Alphaproteobacteria bacterium]
MNILRQLTEKSWETPGAPSLASDAAARSLALPAPSVGLRVFLAVVGVLFSLLIVVYAERMLYEDWRPAPQQWLLWVNTGLLVASSIAFQWAWVSVRRGRLDATKIGLVTAGLFAAAFLVGQLLAWEQLSAMVVFDITNPAIAFFYMITALHGLHMLGGLVAWGRTMLVFWRRPDPARVQLRVRLCATYWHFLLVIWLLLFGLLFSGNDNLNFLLTICGLR